MGNNASGFERYTAVVLEVPPEENEQRFELAEVARLPLGEGLWARSMVPGGHWGFSFHVLEATQGEDESATLQLACPRDPDPRAALFGRLPVTKCTRRQKTTGAGALVKAEGRYLLMGRQLVQAKSAQIEPVARGTPLELAERPVRHLEYMELRNRGRVAVDLGAMDIGVTAELVQDLFVDHCIVDAGGSVLIRFSGGPLPEDAQMPVCDAVAWVPDWPDPLQLYVQGTALLSVPAATDEEKEAEELEPDAWVRDEQGRTCRQQASPGMLNPPCR